MSHSQRFSSQAGIAIGPILFILALLAILAAAMMGGGGDFQTASGADRITTDISTQASLIRSTINECNMQYTLAVSTGSVGPSTDPYPTSDPTNGTAVSALTCPPMGGASLWGTIMLPQPTAGFNPWTYMDASASGGGRCFYTTPTTASPSGSSVIVTGLTRAASKFNSATTYTGANEVLYDPASGTQKFVVWITMPTSGINSHCNLP